MIRIKCSNFVKRQIRTSDFSYSTMSWEQIEELASLIKNHMTSRIINGYRDGVILLDVPFEHHMYFLSSLVKITPDIEFETILEARREGEEPYKKNIAYGKKQPAKDVKFVLYHKDILNEDPNYEKEATGADWEIVSINCTTFRGEAPIPPQTMARNQLADDPEHGIGGTKANYSADEFARSIIFWNTHCLIRERE